MNIEMPVPWPSDVISDLFCLKFRAKCVSLKSTFEFGPGPTRSKTYFPARPISKKLTTIKIKCPQTACQAIKCAGLQCGSLAPPWARREMVHLYHYPKAQYLGIVHVAHLLLPMQSFKIYINSSMAPEKY